MPALLLSSGAVLHYSEIDEKIVKSRGWWEQKSKRSNTSYAYSIERYFCPMLRLPRRRKLYFHRVVTQCPVGLEVDHRDTNGLNNRRWNLRIASHIFNAACREHPLSISGYRGVTPDGRGRYRARITHAEERLSLGTYATAEIAARVYDQKALELLGEFAWLNFNDTADQARTAELAAEQQARLDLASIPF
jgi:hypothetical protein